MSPHSLMNSNIRWRFSHSSLLHKAIINFPNWEKVEIIIFLTNTSISNESTSNY